MLQGNVFARPAANQLFERLYITRLLVTVPNELLTSVASEDCSMGISFGLKEATKENLSRVRINASLQSLLGVRHLAKANKIPAGAFQVRLSTRTAG